MHPTTPVKSDQQLNDESLILSTTNSMDLHSELAHNTFKKLRLQQTFDRIAEFLIIGLVGILVYYNWLMLYPHITPLFWALLFAVLLYKPLHITVSIIQFIDETIADFKLKFYLTSAAVYILFLLSSSLLTIVISSVVFSIFTFILWGERRAVAATILLLIISLAFGLPAYFTVVTCVQESTELAQRIQSFVHDNPAFQTLLDDFGSSPYYIWASDYAKQWGIDLPQYDPHVIKQYIVDLSLQMTSHLTNFLGSIAGVVSSGVQVLISFITFASSLYYFLVHIDTLTAVLPEISPFSEEDSLVLMNSLHRSVTQIFLSSFLIFITHFIGTWVIFTITQVELTLVLSVLTGFMSCVPIGSYGIWVPVTIAKLATGQHLQALAITITQLILQFPIDTAIYSIIPGSAFLIGFSLCAGIYLFGLLGMIIGPLLAGLLITVINMYAVYQRMPRLKIKNQLELDLDKVNETLSLTSTPSFTQHSRSFSTSSRPQSSNSLVLTTTLTETPSDQSNKLPNHYSNSASSNIPTLTPTIIKTHNSSSSLGVVPEISTHASNPQ